MTKQNKKLSKKQACKLIEKILVNNSKEKNKLEFDKFRESKGIYCSFCKKYKKVSEKHFKSIVELYLRSGVMLLSTDYCEDCKNREFHATINYSQFKMSKEKLTLLANTFLEQTDLLEKKEGKIMPWELIEKACIDATKDLPPNQQITPLELNFMLNQSILLGEFFTPKKGLVQRI
ncbi:hypothetical protein FJZ17_04570 [Candidatus Pacearchaeota archaeon]|nr:hypothetical protein [Candidatus Pacearchaeota archaeon]